MLSALDYQSRLAIYGASFTLLIIIFIFVALIYSRKSIVESNTLNTFVRNILKPGYVLATLSSAIFFYIVIHLAISPVPDGINFSGVLLIIPLPFILAGFIWGLVSSRENFPRWPALITVILVNIFLYLAIFS